MEKTTLYLPSALKQALADAGRQSKRPQAELIRDALTRYLADRPRPQPRSIGAGADGVVPARSSKDWVRRQWDREWSRSRARRARSAR